MFTASVKGNAQGIIQSIYNLMDYHRSKARTWAKTQANVDLNPPIMSTDLVMDGKPVDPNVLGTILVALKQQDVSYTCLIGLIGDFGI